MALVINQALVNSITFHFRKSSINSFQPNVSFQCPLKTSKPLVFWCFQGLQKWNIGLKWVNIILVLYSLSLASKEAELLFVDVTEIKRYYLESKLLQHVFTNMSRGVAFDFDSASGRLFYTDVSKNVIYSSFLDVFAKGVQNVRSE